MVTRQEVLGMSVDITAYTVSFVYTNFQIIKAYIFGLSAKRARSRLARVKYGFVTFALVVKMKNG
jgi:hypothetical protein